MPVEIANSNLTDYYESAGPVYDVAIPILLTICGVAVLGNLLVMVSALWVGSWNLTVKLNYSLALSDAWYSSLWGIALIMNSYVRPAYTHHCFNIVLTVFRQGGLLTSAAHLLAISLLHALAVLRPIKYYTHARRRRIECAVIIGLWTVPPVLFTLLVVFVAPSNIFVTCNSSFRELLSYRVSVLTLICTPILVMTVAYAVVTGKLVALRPQEARIKGASIKRPVSRVASDRGSNYGSLGSEAVLRSRRYIGQQDESLFVGGRRRSTALSRQLSNNIHVLVSKEHRRCSSTRSPGALRSMLHKRKSLSADAAYCTRGARRPSTLSCRVSNNIYTSLRKAPSSRGSTAGSGTPMSVTRKRKRSSVGHIVDATKSSLLIVATFLLAWVPAAVWFAITCNTCKLSTDWLILHRPTVIYSVGISVNALLLLKGVVNPFIYAFKVPQVSKAFKCMLKKGRSSVVVV